MKDEEARYTARTLGRQEDALAYCEQIVRAFIDENWREGMTAAEALGYYKAFGEDPWISPTRPRAGEFSAWRYAALYCAQREMQSKREREDS